MKNILLLICVVTLSLTARSQNNTWCGTNHLVKKQIEENPGLQQIMHEALKKAAISRPTDNATSRTLITIPVVVHVIHDNGIGNISEEQVQSALDILNLDYNRLNADTSDTRSTAEAPFRDNAGSMDIEFKLAKIDPDGNCTNGIVRVNAPTLTYGAGEDCKYDSNGGSDQWPKDRYFNIWVINTIAGSSGGITLGYAYYPYGAATNSGYGILIRHDVFGSIETADGEDGRTLTHEMGHALGLPHIFDAGFSGADGCHTGDCNTEGDYSCDTPPQQEANWSCSPTWNSCNNVPLNDAYGFDALDQIENYMSYNACQNMFSNDQVDVMQFNFNDIYFLDNLRSDPNIAATGVNDPDQLCKAEFDVAKRVVCAGTTVEFDDQSFHGPISWTWTVTPGVEGVDYVYANGTTAASQNPEITFIVGGYYDIELLTSDGVTSDSEVKTAFINVLPESAQLDVIEGFEAYTDLSSTNNWTVHNPDNNQGFEILDGTGLSSNKSAFLANYGESGSNTDELISAPLDLSVVDPATEEMTLSFRYAYHKRYDSNDEWLKVFASNNCGESWAQRKTIHGNQLSELTSSNAWYPTSDDDWTTVHMTNITSVYFVENFRYKFEFEGENGNNFFLDNINIYKGAPSDDLVGVNDLEGSIRSFSAYPNPVEGQLNIRFSLENIQNAIVEIVDVTGKVITKNNVQANSGSNLVVLDLDDIAAGAYFIQLSVGETTQVEQLIVR
ncbi:MAG: T9SS type A sorting domain-containing protein [Crocinitomicaceae bacterium]|nr:T9SS type A sorting domain-containing protein [Crocinitomicaceae bacterium]